MAPKKKLNREVLKARAKRLVWVIDSSWCNSLVQKYNSTAALTHLAATHPFKNTALQSLPACQRNIRINSTWQYFK